MNVFPSSALRHAGALAGGVVAVIRPSLPYIGICTMAIAADCVTAWMLARRVARRYPGRAHADGRKFNSRAFGRVIVTLAKAYSLIVMAWLINVHITSSMFPSVDLAKVAAGAICFWQLWSVLENEASCNGARWARLLRRIVIDKTSRHLKIDIDNLISNDTSDNENN